MNLRRRSVPALALMLLSSITVSAQRPGRRAKTPVIAKPAVQSVPAYKGIFEPVSYSEDVNLLDVFFTGADEGWVSGEHGTILHTKDGGQTWIRELGGSPDSAEQPISQLRFSDNRHGWAIVHDTNWMLHTSDGAHWHRAGVLPDGTIIDFQFPTPNTGVMLAGDRIFRTIDAGMTWKQVVAPGACQVKLNISGLIRNTNCDFSSVHFVSQRIAYAVGQKSGNNNTLTVGKSVDGGKTWTAWGFVDPTKNGRIRSAVFLDENTGLLILDNGQLYRTADGARSWHALVTTVPSPGETSFADPQIGWSFYVDCCSTTVSFSIDAGTHWQDQRFVFPAHSSAFSFPRRDRAYIVGEHGMIYRYRIVPKSYAAANSFDASAMPAAGDAILQARTQRVRNDIAALQAKLSAAMASSGGSAASASSASSAASAASPTISVPSASDGTAPSASMEASVGSVASVDASGAGTAAAMTDANSGGTTSQADAASATAPDSTGASSPPDAGASPISDSGTSATAAAGDTTSVPSIDNSAPSAPVAACCAAQVQALQNDVGGLTQQLPTFAGNFRSLNMIVAGLQIFSDLLNKAQTMRDTFRTLKHAPSLQTASAALMQLASNVQSTQQNITAELQNPGSVTLPTSDVSAPAAAAQAFAQPADAGVAQPDASAQPDATAQSSTATPVPQSVPPAASTTASGDSSSSPGGDSVSQQIDNAAQKAKQKLKSKLKWPH